MSRIQHLSILFISLLCPLSSYLFSAEIRSLFLSTSLTLNLEPVLNSKFFKVGLENMFCISRVCLNPVRVLRSWPGPPPPLLLPFSKCLPWQSDLLGGIKKNEFCQVRTCQCSLLHFRWNLFSLGLWDSVSGTPGPEPRCSLWVLRVHMPTLFTQLCFTQLLCFAGCFVWLTPSRFSCYLMPPPPFFLG